MHNQTGQLIPKRYYIVVDFEATCWADENRRGDVEIIEIGCVKMSQQTGRELGEFSTLVRPTRYPKLSQYCIDLTTITQEAVDTAPAFPEALDSFTTWMGDPRQCVLCSWGAYDKFLLRQACRFNRVPYPFDDEYINIKPAFSEIFSGRGVSMERAMEMVDIQQEGRRHSAIDDARNAAKLWREVLRQRKREDG